MLRKAAQTCRRSLVSRLPRCRNLEPPQTSATLGLAGSRATLCPARGGRGAAAAAVSSRGPGPPAPLAPERPVLRRTRGCARSERARGSPRRRSLPAAQERCPRPWALFSRGTGGEESCDFLSQSPAPAAAGKTSVLFFSLNPLIITPRQNLCQMLRLKATYKYI